MTNLIQQANTLKGLTNEHIARLMQQPDGSMPAFLVAAEAERRRAMSQQFAGDAETESVVDMLTRQLANVPQNIQAPMRAPPKMPPPMQPQMQPQMAGIGALPQAQQQMSGGGPVRRFNVGSIVTPTVAGLAGVATGETREQYLERVKRERADAMLPGKAKFLLQNPTLPKTEAQLAEEEVRAANTGLLSGFYSDDSRYDAAQALLDVQNRTAAPPVNGGMTADDRRAPTNPAPDSAPPSSTTGTQDTSAENKYKSMEADMRKRLEGLYADEQPSNWENAQKWFAMSQQIMNPDASLMEGLVNAGSAYSAISADQAAEARQADRAREEALLNYDMQIMQGDRASEAAAAAKAEERAFELQKGQQLRPSDAIGALGDLIKGIDKRLEDSGMMLDDAEKQALLKERQMYEMQLASIMKGGGYGASGVITRDQLSQ
jgi:hypothetical protein